MTDTLKCERCGSAGAVTTTITWEEPWAERTYCLTCLDVLAGQHAEAHPLPPDATCPGCNELVKRDEMLLLANEHGGAGLCPRCHAKGRLPWEPIPPGTGN